MKIVTRLLLAFGVASCTNTPAGGPPVADAPPALPDAPWSSPTSAVCADPFMHIVADGLVPFGPSYGQFPAPAQPPVAYLAPYLCLAVRVESLAPDGLHLRLAADATSGWTATMSVDSGPATAVDATKVAPNVVEANVDVPDHPTYITLIAAPGFNTSCTRNVSLQRFADGRVAVVGYGGQDCYGGPR